MPRKWDIVGRTTRYRAGRLLGSGYYAKVFEVRALLSGAAWAAKVYPADPASKAAAIREIAAFGALSHPRMPTMHETFEQSGFTWVIMDLVPGPSLREAVEAQGPLGTSAALRIGAETCELLDYCGSEGWTYCDLHPRNIHHQTPKGVMVVDFDGARPPGSPGEAGGRIGYRAPEVAAAAHVHPGCHAYSVAGCIHFALTGEDPPTVPGNLPLIEASTTLSEEAIGILEQCRSLDPEARPTVRALGQSLFEQVRRARAS